MALWYNYYDEFYDNIDIVYIFTEIWMIKVSFYYNIVVLLCKQDTVQSEHLCMLAYYCLELCW